MSGSKNRLPYQFVINLVNFAVDVFNAEKNEGGTSTKQAPDKLSGGADTLVSTQLLFCLY